MARNISLLRPFSFTVPVATDSFSLFVVHSTEDIDESSAEELRDATSYAKDNALLIQVPVLGTATKTFWRLSDEATRISRKLALILRNYHSVCKCLTAPLQVSNVWVGSAGNVKLRGARFTTKQCFKSPAMPLSCWPSEQLSAAIAEDSCSYAI